MPIWLTHILDLGGTFVFAISGAVTAVRRRMDIFGVMVLAFAAGNAGGITRDLLIGAVPPAAISNWIYPAVSMLAGLIVFARFPLIEKLNHPVQWFDAVGLAFFAVTGTERAITYGLDPVMAALLGMLTGIGGGMLRDILANEVPVVLRSDLYALAALACASIVAGGHAAQMDSIIPAVTGMVVCFALRYMAIQHGWHLPVAQLPSSTTQANDDIEGQGGKDR